MKLILNVKYKKILYVEDKMKKDFKEFKNFIKGKKVAVVGIGVSNIPLIKFLVRIRG